FWVSQSAKNGFNDALVLYWKGNMSLATQPHSFTFSENTFDLVGHVAVDTSVGTTGQRYTAALPTHEDAGTMTIIIQAPSEPAPLFSDSARTVTLILGCLTTLFGALNMFFGWQGYRLQRAQLIL